MGDFSLELCGGTHLSNTGQVGLCRIVSEEPVAKGVRRVVAFTGRRALERVRQTEVAAQGSGHGAQESRSRRMLPQRIAQLQEEARSSSSRAGPATRRTSVADSVAGAAGRGRDRRRRRRSSAAEWTGGSRAAPLVRGPVARAKGAQWRCCWRPRSTAKSSLLAAVTKDLIAKGVEAGDCVRDAAKAVGGGGGGRPDLAEAGGKDPAKIGEALAAAAAYYRNSLGG